MKQGHPKQSIGRKFSLLLAIAYLSVVILTACSSSLEIRSDSDPTADFSQYHTYDYFDPMGIEGGFNSPIYGEHFRTAIGSEMAQRGYRRLQGTPDLMINVTIRADDRISMRSYSTPYLTGHYYGRPGGAYGGSGMGVGMSSGPRMSTEVSVFVDLVDIEHSKVVWQGVAQFEASDEVAAELLNELLTRELPEALRTAALFSYGDALLRTGKLTEGITRLEALTRDYPESKYAVYGQLRQGRLYAERKGEGDLAKAKQTLNDVLAKRPGDRLCAEARFLLAHVYYQAKDFKETDSGIEYIGAGNQQMGDGGIIVQITDTATGEVVAASDGSWSALAVPDLDLPARAGARRGPARGASAHHGRTARGAPLAGARCPAPRRPGVGLDLRQPGPVQRPQGPGEVSAGDGARSRGVPGSGRRCGLRAGAGGDVSHGCSDRGRRDRHEPNQPGTLRTEEPCQQTTPSSRD